MKLCPWPGLRQVPTVTAAAVAAVGSQVRWQLFTQVLSFCEEEEEFLRTGGTKGGHLQLEQKPLKESLFSLRAGRG